MLHFSKLFHTVEILVLKNNNKKTENVTSYSVYTHAHTCTHRHTKVKEQNPHKNIFVMAEYECLNT